MRLPWMDQDAARFDELHARAFQLGSRLLQVVYCDGVWGTGAMAPRILTMRGEGYMLVDPRRFSLCRIPQRELQYQPVEAEQRELGLSASKPIPYA